MGGKGEKIDVGQHPERERTMMMALQGKQGNNHHGEGCILFIWGPSSGSQSIPLLDSLNLFSWFNDWPIITLNLDLKTIDLWGGFLIDIFWLAI